jgi:hypothetical protein
MTAIHSMVAIQVKMDGCFGGQAATLQNIHGEMAVRGRFDGQTQHGGRRLTTRFQGAKERDEHVAFFRGDLQTA